MTPLRAQVCARPLAGVAQHVFAAVAFDEALDREEQIGPHRLRAEIAAPDAPGDGVHQEQADGGEDQQAGEVVDLLRPDLDGEEIEAPARQVDQHRLRRRVGAAVPAHERQQIIDAERDDQHRPFDAAEGAVRALRIDFPARRIKRDIVVGRLAADFSLRHQTRKSRARPGGPVERVCRGRARSFHSAAEGPDVDGRAP